jgi:hypothetical protein
MDEDVPSFSAMVYASDPDATSLRFRISSQPAHGNVLLDAATGAFTYIPDSDYFGSDSFAFTADDGKQVSEAAEVRLTISPVPDAPRIQPLMARFSDPDEYPTRIPLSVIDVDHDPLMVEVISDDTDVARVSMDESGNAVIVSPRLEGTALITVRVSDGNFVVDEQFDFSSLVVETTRYVAFETPNAASIVLTNVADFDVSFQFDINDHMYPGDRAGSLLRMVEEESLTAEASTPFRIWKALAENIRRGATLTESTWIHGPVRLLSSLGFGYCDDVASAFSILAKEAGYEVRVWTLSGHVVAEVWVDGRWEMYDPDIGVLYHNLQGQIASVEDLATNSALITNPIAPVLAIKQDARAPFSEEVADIYATQADNLVYDLYTQPVEPTDSTLTLPPGATMTIGGFWSHPLLDAPTGNVIPFAARARLDLPAGWTGKLPTAFVIVSVEGMGQLQLNDVFFEIGSAELQARLANFDIPQLAPTITRSDAPIAVTVLVNANSGAFKELNRVFLGGLNVGAISVSPVPNPSATNLK